MKKLILASQSPRRKEIMETAGYDFEIKVSGCEEIVPENVTPKEVAKSLALQKAESVFKENPDCIVIGADTIVVLGNEILGKPKDEKDAKEMLRKLSGNTHRVYTGVAVISAEKTVNDVQETEVNFYDLTDEEIDNYIKTGEPMDKAGAYGIQGKGCLFINGICGDYFNVVGLPIALLSKILRQYRTI